MKDVDLSEICDLIASGQSLRSICRDKGLAESSVRRWIAQDEELMAQSARARELGCDALAEECLEIADDATNDWMEKELQSGRIVEVPDAEAIQRSRLRIETRLKLIGNWSKRYGDKLNVTTQSEVVHRHDLSGYNADELETLERLIAKASDAGRDPSGESPPEPGSVH